MAKARTVRLYIGTRKGTYAAESDAKRKTWKVRGPYHEGRDVFHVKPDPRHPGTVYAAVNSVFFGPSLYRSKNHGKTWTEISSPMMPASKDRHPDPSQGLPTYPVQNYWHIEPGHASEPDTIFVGLDPYSMYRSDDAGESWSPVPGINDHPSKSKWNPGNGGPCLHTILVDPTDAQRMYVGISAAGAFRSDDGGKTFEPANHGVLMEFVPGPPQEVGQCVHKIALDPANPETAYRQDHNGIYVSHDGMQNWTRIGKALKSDFGFVVAAPAARPGTAYFVPLSGETRTVKGGPEVVRWSEKTKKFTPLVRGKVGKGDLGTHREGMTVDALDPPGVYVGTTTGQIVYTPDDGKSWGTIPYMFPTIHSLAIDSG